MPPVVAPNATLTLIAGSGLVEDYDQPEGTDIDRWTGAADARVHEIVETVVIADRVDQVKTTSIVLPRTIGDLVQIGDSLTFEWRTGTFTRKAKDIRGNDISDTTRVWLEIA